MVHPKQKEAGKSLLLMMYDVSAVDYEQHEIRLFTFVGNSKFFPAFGPACSKNLASVYRFHSLPESVFVFPFPVRWLKSPLHCANI